jgi:hypothetical protein
VIAGTIQVVFVHGKGFISDTIEAVEELRDSVKSGFVPSHCGIIVDGAFKEALIDGFISSQITKYPPEITRIYNVTVPDIESCRAKFEEISGRPYGFRALWNGFVYTMTRHHTNGDGEATGDCSEDDTRILRAGGVNVCPGIPADDVTPLILMEALESMGFHYE